MIIPWQASLATGLLLEVLAFLLSWVPLLEWTNALISLILAYSLFQRLWSLALEPQQEGKAIAVLGPLSSFPVTII